MRFVHDLVLTKAGGKKKTKNFGLSCGKMKMPFMEIKSLWGTWK